ncbi:MAG: adenosine deaminase [Acidimicrobiia bacterium]|nr:MAG: adenosine deaminase [Acidimicrobiia bacterium]
MDLASFVRRLPKAELHVHIEGTLEPEMMFELAARNGTDLPFASVEAIKAAYEFTSLQSFLDIYYQGAAVLVSEQDFYDLMIAYLERAHADGVRRAEIFFDPQTHTARGIEFSVFMSGFSRAIDDAAERWGLSAGLIMCFLRHLPLEEAVATWYQAEPFASQIIGVGLDSSEVANPPEGFADVYQLAREAGLHAVAHAGEEGPPEYVTNAIETLEAERIDHGVRSDEDPNVLDMLVRDEIPLTMCPISNVKLKIFDRPEDHNLKKLFDRGVKVTVNSDDPAYFGGYILDNYLAVAVGLGLSREDIVQLARNSIEAAFMPDADKTLLLDELRTVAAQ